MASSDSESEAENYFKNLYQSVQRGKKRKNVFDNESDEENKLIGGTLTRESTSTSAAPSYENVEASTSKADNQTFLQRSPRFGNKNVLSPHNPENVIINRSTPPPPSIDPPLWSKDSVVAENSLVSAHVYKAFHQHQKIFQ